MEAELLRLELELELNLELVLEGGAHLHTFPGACLASNRATQRARLTLPFTVTARQQHHFCC